MGGGIQSFPRIIVQKVEKSSYIINTMESLAQIYDDFASYFIKNKMPEDKQKIVGDFKEYMKNIWDKKKENKTFCPMEFMKKLIKISNEYFSLEIELEPFEFYDYILDKLNEELNGFDKDITNYHNKLIEKYKEDREIKDYLDNYIKDNDSIVSKTFNGIMKKTKFCSRCLKDKKQPEYDKFYAINIDINDYYQKEKVKNFSVEKCIEYYFKNDKETNGTKKCDNCKDSFKEKFKTSIVELPNYLIFRIIWGKFRSGVGFINSEIKPSYNSLDVNETIEIKKDYLNDIAYNRDNKIKLSEEMPSIKFQLFSIINYYDKDKIFITKYKIKENNSWFNFWSNGKGKETKTYIDDFSVPCLLFYEKIK